MSSLEEKKFLAVFLSIFVLLPALNIFSRQITYTCGSCGCGSAASLSVSASPPHKQLRELKDKEKEAVISRIKESADYKLVADLLGGWGLHPVFGSAYAAEGTATQDGVTTKTIGASILFIRESDGFTVVSVFIVEPSVESIVLKFDLEADRIYILYRTVGGKSLGLPYGGTSLLSECDPCYLYVYSCESISWSCVVANCSDCFWSCICLPACLQGCALCLMINCLPAFYQCCNWQWVCKPCTSSSCYEPACMDCPVCSG
jgi:hypothetical protein